ncbi:LamG-like jellyroll fold domain-containing protein [Prosthecobacter sp.]
MHSPSGSFSLQLIACIILVLGHAVLHAAPAVSAHPQSLAVEADAAASLTVTATGTGTGTLNYQWQKDGVDIPGATSSTFGLTNAKPWHIGDYTVRVTDSSGTLISSIATLSLTGQNTSIWKGLVYYFPLGATGNDNGFLANHLNGTAVSPALDRHGIASGAYSFSRATLSRMVSTENIVIAGTSQRSVSFWARFSPTYQGIPSGKHVALFHWGSSNSSAGTHFAAMFNPGWDIQRAADGPYRMWGGLADNVYRGPFSYDQWRHYVLTLGDASSSTNVGFYINGVLATKIPHDQNPLNTVLTKFRLGTISDDGSTIGSGGSGDSYDFGLDGAMDDVRIYNRALTSAEVYSLYESEATVTVQISSQPQTLSVIQNAAASFSVTATGIGNLSYQWQKDGVNIPGATSSSYSLAGAKPWHIGDYTVRVTDANGTSTSNAATLSVTGINSGIWKGLMAFFPFNGNASDLGVFANSSSVHGPQLIVDRLGLAQSAYAFCGPLNPTWTSGPSYIEVPDTPALRPAKNLTLSIWAKASLQSFQGYVHMITKRISLLPPGPYNSWTIGTPDSGRSTIQYGADNRTIWNSELINGFSVLNGGWQQFVMTVTDTKQALYVDGVLVHQGDVSNSPFTYSAESLLIGTAMKGAAGEDQEWYGALDDIRVYNRAMSGSEVAALYAAENAPNNWRQTHFGSTARTGSAADNEDPDKDGMPNLLEYALNLPPNAASRVPASVQATGGNLEYLYNRGTAAFNGGTAFQVQWSDDLTTWSTTGVVESLLSDNGTHQQVKATLPAGSGSRRFVRLRVQ